MTHPLHSLNAGLADLATEARRSLVHVRDGRRGDGAGVILHPAGLILTSAHVVRREPVQVTLPDGRTMPAKVLAHDRARDLAALSVDADELPTLPLGDSSQLRTGEWVMALGHPWGVAGAATAGVVIGVGADLPEAPGAARGMEWVAVDLHVRPGHSGGSLVDSRGRLVGINTIMAGPEVGLAVPAHVAKAFLRDAMGTRDAGARRVA